MLSRRIYFSVYLWLMIELRRLCIRPSSINRFMIRDFILWIRWYIYMYFRNRKNLRGIVLGDFKKQFYLVLKVIKLNLYLSMQVVGSLYIMCSNILLLSNCSIHKSIMLNSCLSFRVLFRMFIYELITYLCLLHIFITRVLTFQFSRLHKLYI